MQKCYYLTNLIGAKVGVVRSLELAGENGGRKALSIGLQEASGSDGSAAAPRALHTTLRRGQAGGLGGIAVTGAGLVLNLLVVAVKDRRRKSLSIGFDEASSTDSSTLAPRALLAIGRAGHASILTGEGVTASSTERYLLELAGEDRGRKALSI